MRLCNRRLMEDLQGVVVMVRLIIEGNSEVVAKGVYNDNHSFIKYFWMPASIVSRVEVMVWKGKRRYSAFRFEVEDKSGEEEALRKEEDAERVDTTIRISSVT